MLSNVPINSGELQQILTNVNNGWCYRHFSFYRADLGLVSYDTCLSKVKINEFSLVKNLFEKLKMPLALTSYNHLFLLGFFLFESFYIWGKTVSNHLFLWDGNSHFEKHMFFLMSSTLVTQCSNAFPIYMHWWIKTMEKLILPTLVQIWTRLGTLAGWPYFPLIK